MTTFEVHFEFWRATGKGHGHQEETGWKMSEHHCVHKADVPSQPGRSEMGAGVQYVDGKEDEAEVVFRNSEATEEPVGDQGIGQKASAESVERK
jgi:hypothetical protein